MTTQPNFDTMTDAELANYHYTHRDSPLGDEADLEDIEVEIAHPLSVSMSFRLPPEEASAIRQAAAQVGISRSDWIRGVCSAAAEVGTQVNAPVPSQRVNMTKARRLVAELDKELNRGSSNQSGPATKSTRGRSGTSQTEE
ncbi:MAG: plasmid mobilization protein [Pseudonocardiaceae bacterium]